MHLSQSFRRRITQFLALLACLFGMNLLMGCRSTKTVVQPQESVGQQLMDLDKALQSGAISQKEYERLRESIMDRNK